MKLIIHPECYSKMPQAEYGHDAYGNVIEAPSGYKVIVELDSLKRGDIPFDVYAGWMPEGYYHPDYHLQAVSDGRWTTWARPK